MQTTLEKRSLSTTTQPPAAPAAPVRSLNISYDERLDHLRFLAAFIIIVFHSFPPMFAVVKQIPCDWNYIIKNLSDLNGLWLVPRAMLAEGQSAVGLFLTLSGFLFARITSKSDIIPHKFYLNRLLRIYPLYMCFIVLALFLEPGASPFQSLCLSVLTLQNLPSATAHMFLTPHLWSVAVEFQIYLLFPVLLAEYRNKGVKALFFFIAAALVIKLLVYLMAGDVQGIAYRTTFGRIDQFLIGAILGYSFNSFKDKIKHPIFLLLAFAFTAAVITTFHAYGGTLFTARKSIWIVWPALESIAWGAFMVAYCASSVSLPSLISKALSFLGGISYSLYVTHYAMSYIVTHRLCTPVYNFNQQVLIPLFGNSQQEAFVVSVLVGALAVVPATILVSCFTYYAIEKPFMNRRVKYTVPLVSETVASAS